MGVTVGPGATIAGRYRLESPIGEGGFGAVFRATDLHTRNPVTVKVLMQGAVESGARFKREAELAMRLSHPNTVRTHDAGEDPGAGPYIVLELLEGGSLEQVLRAQGGLGPRLAVEIALAVLGSLGEAHAMGIVHRDIKPANVFLRRAPVGGVKVLDFGIAKSTNEGTRAGLTREGQTIGTPAYMAPEQVKGGELGPETDLYALGLVLAEAISANGADGGRLIFIDGASPSALPAAEAARKPDEPDAIYALRGPKFLYLTLSPTRAKDLLPSLCGWMRQGAALGEAIRLERGVSRRGERHRASVGNIQYFVRADQRDSVAVTP